MKIKTVIWIAAIVFAIAAIIDIWDGQVAKLISSVCMCLALISYALGMDKTNQAKYKAASFFLVLISLAAFIYRLFQWYYPE